LVKVGSSADETLSIIFKAPNQAVAITYDISAFDESSDATIRSTTSTIIDVAGDFSAYSGYTVDYLVL